MFQPVSGPSQDQIQVAAERLSEEAIKNGGKVHCVREDAPEGRQEWILMNQAAKWMESEGIGQMSRRTNTSFIFSLNC